MRITSRPSAALASIVVALSALASACGSDGTAAKPAGVTDLRVSPAAATPTVPGVCAPRPARPTTAGGAEPGSTAPMPAKPGACTK
ncbi:MAG: hypothetical protein IT302_07280 [Dehalococcoidia bacterium]|nr:hypothetical protein [Dehalococcoidia bacterium]